MRGGKVRGTIGVVTAALAAFGANAQEPVGRVAEITGEATIDRAGDKSTVATGAGLMPDDIVATGRDGRVRMRFTDGSELSVGPDGEVVIDEYVFANQPTDTAIFTIAKGPARLVTGLVERSNRAGVKINTPVASIGIRGTDVFAEVDGQQLSAALFSGYSVDVTNSNGTTTLHPGEGTDSFDGRGPTPAIGWSADRINRAYGLVSFPGANRRPLPYLRASAEADSVEEAITDGALFGHARYRYEWVDADNRAQSAHSSTFRLRVGYETAALNGFFAGAEGEVTREIGGNRRNDGVNGRATLPLIPDPESEVLNQAYVGWSKLGADGSAAHRAVLGRQTIAYENERWIGPVGFRQNDQTFDAVHVETRALDGWTLRYAYVDRVNRVLGNNPNGHWDSDSHLIGATTNIIPNGITTAYTYLLDLKPVPLLSSATYGVRYDGVWSFAGRDTRRVLLEAEFAEQTDYATNPRDYALSYWLLRPGVMIGRLSVWLGWERLGGNGLSAVQAPLSTLHRHNGWADIFTTTPPGGLSDAHVRVLYEFRDAGPLKNPRIDLRAHDFQPTGGRRYGREFDFDLNASVRGLVTVGVRGAFYDAASFDADTQKLFVYAELPF